ncbi:MAG TPA: HAD family acid phosphatase [Myxococcaceae bacterium]|jgi:phosphoglycolate phosphatase-like HAD superfamily hydrolase
MLPVGLGPAKPVTASKLEEIRPADAGSSAPRSPDSFKEGAPAVDGPTPKPEIPAAEPVDGRAWMQDAIEDIKARVANGEKVKVVFDLDDTIWDNRPRTVELAHRFDAERGTHLFDGLTVDQVGRDGFETAVNAGLSRQDARAFNAYWQPRVFTAEMADFDAPQPEIDDLARQAHDAGAEVVYLTGRPETERDVTRGELQRMGLPDADDAHLILKPSLNQSTPAYKVAEFRKMVEAGDSHLSWFLTESRRDLGAVQDAKLGIPTVLLDAPWERGGRPLDPGTPIFPAQAGPRDDQVIWAA